MAAQLIDYVIKNNLGCSLDPETPITKIISGFMNGNIRLVLRPGPDLDKDTSQLRSWTAYGARCLKQWVSRKIGEKLQHYVKAESFSSRNVVKVTKGLITLQNIQFRSVEFGGVALDICVKKIKVKVEKGKIVVQLIGLTYGISSGIIAALCYGVAASAIVAYLAPHVWGSAELARRAVLYGIGVKFVS